MRSPLGHYHRHEWGGGEDNYIEHLKNGLVELQSFYMLGGVRSSKKVVGSLPRGGANTYSYCRCSWLNV